MNRKRALRELKEIEKLAPELRLAADGWDKDWKTLIATLMSARTTDRITIPVAEELFRKYNSLAKLSQARLIEIQKVIKPVNYYKTKARNIAKLANILVKAYNSKVPLDFSELIELPGVGRKTANVFLAEYGCDRIGVDTHVAWIARQMGWTQHEKQEFVERDLEVLFPKRYWGRINWILVRFGQTYSSRKNKIRILGEIRRRFSNELPLENSIAQSAWRIA